jgi:peptide/nickel transport system substrate-binding protein
MTRFPRRSVVNAGLGLLAAPALAQRAGAQELVMQADTLAVLDPVVNQANVGRDFGYMVFDMLYGTDAAGDVSPQMAAGHTSEDDGRRITITLRDGLLFHDGERVRAADCVASLRRWMVRDLVGQEIAANLDALAALDDRRFQFRLKRAFPRLIPALGKLAVVPVMMPERLAQLDPFKPVPEIIGSGPYRFNPAEWNAGNSLAFTRFDRYSPTSGGTPTLTAGPKLALTERVVWRFIADPTTTAAALRTGEIDWWPVVTSDLKPLLARSRDIIMRPFAEFGSFAYLRPNHLHPPFDRAEVRRALLHAVRQEDFLAVLAGDDRAVWRSPSGFFTPGSQMASEAGLENFRGDIAGSRSALAAAGAAGARVVLMVPGDLPEPAAVGQVAGDLVRRIGLALDYTAMDWAAMLVRRTKKEPPEQGGWNAFISLSNGWSASDPLTHTQMRAGGQTAWVGWPDIPEMERLRGEWLYEPDAAARRRIAVRMQLLAFDQVPYIPLCHYVETSAIRRNVQGVRVGHTAAWNVVKN